jgi:hypothetical protein
MAMDDNILLPALYDVQTLVDDRLGDIAAALGLLSSAIEAAELVDQAEWSRTLRLLHENCAAALGEADAALAKARAAAKGLPDEADENAIAADNLAVLRRHVDSLKR